MDQKETFSGSSCWPNASISARIDLSMEVVNILIHKASNKIGNLSAASKHLISKLSELLCLISITLAGRILRFMMGEPFSDIVGERISGSHVGSPNDIDQSSYHLFLCCVCLNQPYMFHNTEEFIKWKHVVQCFAEMMVLKGHFESGMKKFHDSVAYFLGSRSSARSPMLREELDRQSTALKLSGSQQFRRLKSDFVTSMVKNVQSMWAE